jgi:hypothetical protein
MNKTICYDIIDLSVNTNMNAIFWRPESGTSFDKYVRATMSGNLSYMENEHIDYYPRYDYNGEICVAAILSGNIECLKFAVTHGYPLSAAIANEAASRPCADMLRYLFINRCPIDYMASLSAVSHGSIDCLQFLIDHGCPIHSELCSIAIYDSHIECYECLIKYNCGVDQNMTLFAATNGSLDGLIIAHNYGHKLHPEICSELMATRKHFDCFLYALYYGNQVDGQCIYRLMADTSYNPYNDLRIYQAFFIHIGFIKLEVLYGLMLEGYCAAAELLQTRSQMLRVLAMQVNIHVNYAAIVVEYAIGF